MQAGLAFDAAQECEDLKRKGSGVLSWYYPENLMTSSYVEE